MSFASKRLCHVVVATSVLSLLEGAAFAQQQMTVASNQTKSGLMPHAVELGVGPSLSNVLKDSSGIGIGGELGLTDHVTATASFEHFNLVKPKSQREKRHSGDLDTSKVSSTSATFGARYYFNPGRVDSWYTGGRVQSENSTSHWQFEDSRFSEKYAGIGAGAEIGYRWVYDNGMLVRLGGAGIFDKKLSHKIKEENDSAHSQEGRKKLEDRDKNFKIDLDLTVGYAF